MFHFSSDSSTPELLMRAMLAVNQLTVYHAVSIWSNRVQNVHQSELAFDLNLSVDDVTTSVQHGTLIWLKQRATHRLPEFKSLGDDDDDARSCRVPAHVSTFHNSH